MELLDVEKLFTEIIDAGEDGERLFQTRSRDGIFGPALTMWLMMCKRLQGGDGIRSAVQYLVDGGAREVVSRNRRSERFREENISTNSGGLSRAQSRLNLEDVKLVTRRLEKYLLKDEGKALWNGQQVYLMDGTKVTLNRKGGIIAEYHVSRNQSGQAYTPLMQCLFCHELFSGIALEPAYGPYRGPKAVCETELSYELIKRLPQNSLLIADRGFGIFPVAYAAQAHGIDVLVRITRTRAGYIAGQEALKSENCDLEKSWRLRGTRVSKLDIPPGFEIKGRFIKATIKRKGVADLELLFFTTSKAPAAELVALYEQRERIEHDIRSLKHSLGMERLWSQTPKMVEKELLLGVAAYNLVRIILAQAAKELKIEPRKISFSSAANLIRIFGKKMRDATTEQQQEVIRQRLLTALNQSKLPNRQKRRMEPRKLARQKDSYPLMRKSREIERQKSLHDFKKAGHRGLFHNTKRKF